MICYEFGLSLDELQHSLVLPLSRTSSVGVGVFVVVTSGIVWTILKSTMGIRVSEEDEIAGLDTSELGMEAYPEFSKG